MTVAGTNDGAAMTSALSRPEFFIGGEWLGCRTAAVYEVIEAATEAPLGIAPLAGNIEIDTAVDAARQALDPWRSMSAVKRADHLDRLGAALRKRAKDTAALTTRENGMPISLSLGANGFAPSEILRYYAGLTRHMCAEDIRRSFWGGRTVVRHEPVGVVAAITPWNYPQPLAAMKIAPALAAGCTVILKPSPETSLDAFVFADAAIEVGLPAGVLNVVPAGREVSEYLARHPGVDKVAFTGSTPAGRAIGAACGSQLKPVTLELGGKSAAIVTEHADLAKFADAIPEVCLSNNGQTCHASTRILAPTSRYDEIVDAVTESVRTLVVGDPLDESTQIGPLVSAAQRDRVLGYIQSGRDDGFRITTGGGAAADQALGWYVAPTVFADVSNSAQIAQEEIFGPVLTIIRCRDLDEMIAIANDSAYGLAGTVWTTDDAEALAIADRIETGTVGVNHYQIDIAAPFGGYKASGMGRELGPEGLESYHKAKSVYFAPPS